MKITSFSTLVSQYIEIYIVLIFKSHSSSYTDMLVVGEKWKFHKQLTEKSHKFSFLALQVSRLLKEYLGRQFPVVPKPLLAWPFLLLCSLKPVLIKMVIKMSLRVHPITSLTTALFHDLCELMIVCYQGLFFSHYDTEKIKVTFKANKNWVSCCETVIKKKYIFLNKSYFYAFFCKLPLRKLYSNIQLQLLSTVGF